MQHTLEHGELWLRDKGEEPDACWVAWLRELAALGDALTRNGGYLRVDDARQELEAALRRRRR